MSLNFLSKNFLISSSFILILTASAQVKKTQSNNKNDKPNIVYIVADDLGWKDVGFHNADKIQTPNIDKLAKGGARLDRFYVQPFCTPSRAALMTGRYPFRYGLQTIVIPSKGTYGLSTEEKTLPELLKKAGYRTEMIGKWHLGHADRKYWPRQRGFDYHYGAVLGEIDYYTHASHNVVDWQRNNEAVHEQGYVTQLLGTDAVKRIQQHDQKKPLFMYLAFTAPHTPYQAPEEYLNMYSHISDKTRRTYAAMISVLDDEIGKVVSALEAKGMRENTLIVFHSDNGGARDPKALGEGAESSVPADNGPLKGGKSELYEGGTRVPAFAYWPGRIKSGTEVKELIHVVDMLPTLVKLAQGSTSTCKDLDGKNIWPAISDGSSSNRDEVVYNISPLRSAIRQKEWKLVWTALIPQKIELFNLEKDPYEKENVAKENPQIVAALKDRIEKLSAKAQKPLFFEAASKAVFEGIFGPAPIPIEDNSGTSEP